MARARRAGWTALIVVVLVASIAGWRRRRAPSPRPSLAAVDARRVRGADRWDVRVRRVRRARQPGRDARRSRRARGRLRHLVRLDRDAQGDLDAATILAPGQRLLIANAAGVHAVDRRCDLCRRLRGDRRGDRVAGRRRQRDRCRRMGRCHERVRRGHGAAAPPAGSSLERAPGGPAGNGTDTNDNSVDWFVQAAPSPQGLAAPPVPGPTATPTPTRRPRRRARRATPTPTATPTPDTDADAHADSRRRPSNRRRLRRPRRPRRPSRRRRPTPTPSPTPARRPTPTPSPTPVPTPTPRPLSIAAARALADGQSVRDRGRPDDGPRCARIGPRRFVQDASGGIALYLDAVGRRRRGRRARRSSPGHARQSLLAAHAPGG